jgi:type III pantothenate kinase
MGEIPLIKDKPFPQFFRWPWLDSVVRAGNCAGHQKSPGLHPPKLRQTAGAKEGANIISKLGTSNKNGKKGPGFFSNTDLCFMNLIVDAGNTFVKFAVYKSDRLESFYQMPLADFCPGVKKVFEAFPGIRQAIVSSVTHLDKNCLDVLKVFCPVHLLDQNSRVPFKNSYATPQTLGVDRIALATAAFYHNPHGNTLVVDAGSCITYDMVNDYGEYLGGAISPGLRMRYTAMHDQTSRLPQLDPEEELPDFIGNSTQSSMHSGVIHGICFEIDGFIDMYTSRFSHLTVILTGGDAQFLSKRLKSTIFANSNFLLEGLNYLLEYNRR